MDFNLTGQIGGMTANLTGQVAVSTLVQVIKALNCNSGACSDYQQFYSSLMQIVITLFSFSGISIFYFWQQHEEREKRINAIKEVLSKTNVSQIEENLKSEIETRIHNNVLDSGTQMRADAYKESYVYNRDWFNTKPIPNWVLTILSMLALFFGLIVPIDLQLPDPILLHFLSCNQIFHITTIGIALCIIILGFASYLKSKAKSKEVTIGADEAGAYWK